ncbi:MAG: DUF4367 domain-containing protein [Ruminococcus sp.]|nr:DUF4367 domain-containing protein [Ruminococcus sp.]
MNEYSVFIEALNDVFEKEVDTELEKITINDGHLFSESYKKKMDKLINQRSKPYYNMISTAGRRAACIAAAIIILSASALSVSAVREAFFGFITKIFGDHTEISVDKNNSDSYPASIEKEYYISELPSGFTQTERLIDNHSLFVSYSNNDKYIFFEQYTIDSYIQDIDNEQTGYETIYDDYGSIYKVMYSEVDDSYTIIWNNNEYAFTILSNLNKEDVLDLCSSTKVKE